jgi:succinate-semialdehyde dehydrogenase / glutarate-semialdehyde dehydrogenase
MTTTPLLPSSLVTPDPGLLAASDRLIAALPTALRVGGGISIEKSPRTPVSVTDPGTGEQIDVVFDADADTARHAVGVAADAGREWASTTTRQRSDVLRRAYELMVAHQNDFELLIAREMGKPLGEARGEFVYGSDFVRWYADEAVRPGGTVRPSPYGDGRLLSSRSPVGLCLLITPWNFPLAMATRKIAPALAAGCSVILKPATLTPLTSLFFADLLREAGVPEGVVNVVTSSRAGELSSAVMNDSRVRKVSFTGSTEVGVKLLEQAAGQVLRTSMELGGNAPFIVLDDADLERAVAGAMKAKLRNGGQSCIAANRFLVQDGIAAAFTEAFTEAMSATVVGHALGHGVQMGPLIDAKAQASMESLVQTAISEGAEVLTGGHSIDSAGSFFAPTVLDRVRSDSRIAHTEIFGPIATITRFATDAEALTLANDTPYGLAGYVFGQDIDRVLSIADHLETGMVGINQGVVSNVAAPFGGIKQSGIGREGGAEGLEEYQNIRLYNIAQR